MAASLYNLYEFHWIFPLSKALVMGILYGILPGIIVVITFLEPLWLM